LTQIQIKIGFAHVMNHQVLHGAYHSFGDTHIMIEDMGKIRPTGKNA
jgi:hypothetical protein